MIFSGRYNNARSTLPENTPFSVYCLIIILPFVLLYWMSPFISDWTLSMDYPLHPINEQMELLFSIKNGSFPLFVPGYHLGHSSSALTLGQLFHPISLISSLLPGYWSGKSLEWNTFLRILTLGLTHLSLFVFLRKIKLNTFFSFVLSLITVYNFRMLEAFRYGASLEAFTGHLLLCSMIGLYFIGPSKWLMPLSIIFMTYLLVCSGHPPMMFYGFMGAVLFALIMPFYMSAMHPDSGFIMKNAIRFWARVGLFICLGVLLSSAYIIPLKFEFVDANSVYTRFGLQPDMGQDTFAGAMNNFFIPFGASLLSSFGGSSLIIIALLLPLLQCVRVNIPLIIWFIWGVLIYVLLYILGPETPVYRWAWKYLPVVSSLGQVGRIAMIAPTIIMLLLAWTINAHEYSYSVKGLSIKLTPCRFLGLAALLVVSTYLLILFLLKPELGYFTPHFVRNISFSIEIVSALLGLFSLAMLAAYNMSSRFARMAGVFLCILVVTQTGINLKHGIWIERKKDRLTFEQFRAQKREKLEYDFLNCPNTQHYVILDHISRSFMEPFLGKIFTQVVPAVNQDEAYAQMQKERIPQQLFIENYAPMRANKITEGAKNMSRGEVKLVYSSFNRLQFRISSQSPAFFGLSYPYTGQWSAWLNGEKVHVYRGNGASHAVEIPAGESLIEFRYWSNAFFWGVLLTCMTFTAIGLYVCSGALGGYLRVIGSVIVILIGTGVFILWYNSLYTGDNLNTEYRWPYTPPQYPMNIAYGKKISGYMPFPHKLQLHGSRAIDGDNQPHSGFSLTPLVDEPLIVDLHKIQEIRTILLYGENRAKPVIALSRDGRQWQELAFDFTEGNGGQLLHISLNKSAYAQFVKIEAGSSQKVVIDELEVYNSL